MVVPKLDHYLYDQSPVGVKYFVDIKEQVAKYSFSANINEEPPLVVIDLTSPFWFGTKTSKVLQLCGGRSDRFVDNVKLFLTSLKKQGVRLVYFCNSYTKDEDVEKWSERAESRYAKEISVLDMFYEGATLNDVADFCDEQKIHVSLHKMTTAAIHNIARQTGRIYRVYDVSKAVATYASVNKAFAVLGSNSDYLIFEGNWRYWNVKRLKLSDMMVLEFNKEALKKHLRLSSGQMKVLSMMLGNHIIDLKEVKTFHCIMVKKPLVETVATVISKFTKETPDETDIKPINSLWTNLSDDILRQTLDYYTVDSYFKEPKVSDKELINKLYFENDLFSYQVLRNKYLYSALQFVDLRRDDIPSYCKLSLNLRRKCIGVLCKNRLGTEHRQTFVIKLHHEKGYEVIEKDPIYPTCTVPPLDELFDPLFTRTIPHTYMEDRFDLLKFLISEKLTREKVNIIQYSIPIQYLTTAMTIFYMYENKCLSLDEADIFTISTYSTVMKLLPTKKVNPPETLNDRAFRLTFLFLRLREHIQRCFTISGLPHLNELLNFDGFHFHQTYNKYIHASKKEKEDQMAPVSKYVQLYRTS